MNTVNEIKEYWKDEVNNITDIEELRQQAKTDIHHLLKSNEYKDTVIDENIESNMETRKDLIETIYLINLLLKDGEYEKIDNIMTTCFIKYKVKIKNN